MDEAITDLHNAIHLALSLNRGTAEGTSRMSGDDFVPAESSSSTTESRISSLSGSMIEQSQKSSSTLNRIKLSLHNNNSGEGNNDSIPNSAWQRHCLGTAKNVEDALSNYELALLNVHNDGIGEPIYFIANEDGSDQTSIVDLLVVGMTSVTRHLMQQCDKHLNGLMGSNSSNAHFLTAMEQSCYTIACISANSLMKWFCDTDSSNADIPLLEERHVGGLIEDVAVSCEDDVLSQFVEPMVTVVNAILERRHNVFSGYEGGFFSNLSAKDCLFLASSLMQRFTCQQPRDNTEIETSSHISLFISSLLEHFCVVLGTEKFEEWADAFNEYMERNLNDEEMLNIPVLVSQYHVLTIESALELLENAESLIESSRDNVERESVESIVTTVQDTIRSSMTAISTTATMETLGIIQNPQIKVVFYPLLASFTKFIVSGLEKALDVLRKVHCSHEIEGICKIADDLLFRLCCTSNGIEFFKSGEFGGKEILAVACLRAVSAGCIQSKAKPLLALAEESARRDRQDNRQVSAEVTSKRQRFNYSLSSENVKASSSTATVQKNSPNTSTLDVLLCCLSLSQHNRGHASSVEQSHIEEVSCITTALMLPDTLTREASNGSDAMVVDPLNPWHSLQLKPLMQLMADEHSSATSNESNSMMESLISYTSALPPCCNIRSSVLK